MAIKIRYKALQGKMNGEDWLPMFEKIGEPEGPGFEEKIVLYKTYGWSTDVTNVPKADSCQNFGLTQTYVQDDGTIWYYFSNSYWNYGYDQFAWRAFIGDTVEISNGHGWFCHGTYGRGQGEVLVSKVLFGVGCSKPILQKGILITYTNSKSIDIEAVIQASEDGENYKDITDEFSFPPGRVVDKAIKFSSPQLHKYYRVKFLRPEDERMHDPVGGTNMGFTNFLLIN